MNSNLNTIITRLPKYSAHQLLQSINKTQIGFSTQTESTLLLEGWKSVHKEIPESLVNYIIESAKKGFCTAEEIDYIENSIKCQELNTRKVQLIMEIELEKAKKRIKEKEIRDRWIKILVGIGSSLLLLISAFVIFWLLPFLKDRSATVKYIIIDSYILRAEDGTATNKRGKFGDKVLVYSVDPEGRAEVKVNGNNGYFDKADLYLVDEEVKNRIENIYGNKEAIDESIDSSHKKLLADYIIKWKKEQDEDWKIYGFPKKMEYKSTVSGKFMGNTNECAAIILTEKEKRKRKLLIFSWDEEGEIEKLEKEISLDFEYKELIDKNRKKLPEYVKVNSIIIGKGDDSSKEKLLVYYDKTSFKTKKGDF